jgi:hypothetical protein
LQLAVKHVLKTFSGSGEIAMLQKMREWIKAFVYLDLMFTVMYCLITAVFGILFLILVVIGGNYDQIFPLLGSMAGALAFLGFFFWISRDARKVGKELRRQRKHPKPRPDGDMSDVAGIPQQPPWMG